MANGGQTAIRGYLIQTLIALLDALEDGREWQSVTLEPNVDSDKVDILWKYSDGTKAVQVKSSVNPFSKGDIERWAMELESWREADEYELVLVGIPASPTVARIRKEGTVAVPPPKNLDLPAFKEQAAHRLDRLLQKHDLYRGDADHREMLAGALSEKLATLSTGGHKLTRSALVNLLTGWLASTAETGGVCTVSSKTVRIIRVFVSSPEDVSEERAVLDELCASINRTEGQTLRMRLEVFTWERDATPQIGPGRSKVLDGQMPPYDIYLGIMKYRFGTATGRYGAGTEKEFHNALRRWGKVGSPWLLFYFSKEKVDPDQLDMEQYAKVRQFREKLQEKGLRGTYDGVRGSKDAFYETVSEHLRKIIGRLLEIEAGKVKPRQSVCKGKWIAGSAAKTAHKPIVPPEYKAWLRDQCSEVELMGLQPKHGVGIRLNQIYTPLVSAVRSERRRGASSKSLDDLAAELRQEPRETAQLILDLLDKDSLYVSGDPGSGKSTFCRWVTWLTCNGVMPTVDIAPPEQYQEKFPEQLRDRLPVLVSLRDFWTHLPPSGIRSIGFAGLEQTLEQWLAQRKAPGMSWSCLSGHLQQGSALLMLDGVDEVPPIRNADDYEWYPREMLHNVLPEVIKRWTQAGNRVLVTSRPYGLDAHQEQRLALEHAPIQAMGTELQALLVRRWFVRLNEGHDLALKVASDMLDHLHGERGLDELAANPLLLTAMCIIYDEGKRLPADKHELYDRIVDTVLHKRYPAKERVDEVRGRLEAIALGMHTGVGLGQQRANPEASASEHEIDLLLQDYRQLDGATDQGLSDTVHVREELLSRSGLLVSRGDGRAAFYHLSFQEFLAAQRLFIKLGRQQQEFTAQLVQRAESAGWRNTLSFVFGSLVSKFNPHEGVKLLQDIADKMQLPSLDESQRGQGAGVWNQALVLGDCLEILDGRKAAVPGGLSGLFERVVMQAIEQEITVKDRNTLAKALGRMGDPRIVTDLRAQGHPDGHPGYVNIPAGRYRYGENKQPFPISELFRLSRYPVTNSQYECFIEDGGYQNQKLWSEEGWGWREQEQVSEPEYWRHHDFAAPNQPVVGVSFWEAEAFTTWAGGVLPSERQWEAAARGPRGYEYTWGNTWEDVICNSEEAGLGSTSAVGIFPRSRSRDFGLEDMAGNVWEWCSAKEASFRVIRGGSWFNSSKNCRAAIRDGFAPSFRYFYLGFRVTLVPPGKRAGTSKRKRTEHGAEAEGAKRRSPPPRAGVEGDGGEGKRAVRPKERN